LLDLLNLLLPENLQLLLLYVLIMKLRLHLLLLLLQRLWLCMRVLRRDHSVRVWHP
jgi:hypothetical protein